MIHQEQKLLLTLFHCLFIFYCSFVFSFLLFLFSSSPHRSSLVNEVLIFNDSLNVQAPSAPIPLPVHYFIIHFHFIFYSYFSSQLRYSLVNVVLIFNDSLNAQAPSAPIPLAVHYFILFHFVLLWSFFFNPFFTHNSNPVKSKVQQELLFPFLSIQPL